MKKFFTTLPKNILGCFQGRMILWHLLFIALTFILVCSGFDWFYFSSTRSPVLREWMFPSAPIGGLVPITLPLILIVSGFVISRERISLTGWAIGQAALIGSLLSSTYKAFTGRVHPEHLIGENLSYNFQFGWLRGGVFWGWPSSHTTIAFAMAVTLFTLFPKKRWFGGLALVYAFYIRSWRFNDHPLVFGFRGGGHPRLHHRRGRRKEFFARSKEPEIAERFLEIDELFRKRTFFSRKVPSFKRNLVLLWRSFFSRKNAAPSGKTLKWRRKLSFKSPNGTFILKIT